MTLFIVCALLWARVFQNHRKEVVQPSSDLINEFQLRVSVAENIIEHQNTLISQLEQEEHILDNKIWWYTQNGLPCSSLKDKQEKLQQKIWSEKLKRSKAEIAKISSERRLNKCISK